MSDALETVNAICQDVQTRRLNAEMSGRDAHLALQNHLAEKGRKVTAIYSKRMSLEKIVEFAQEAQMCF